ncbi:hypothetical protein HXX76_000675 [Chlamydomonas incerta]|uniref:Uncharacterized protein n=1 Tax=Chlamydomonas incerta TaxID=51695 RepID=A0A836B2U2_CHLIN|nr:hypothetical protein HXX76_000675 [Chlamydomonas incerta]|eukprot:KAG2446075.1 hypothetical protein HXX76_000675 [Chlamydomonas incerta]
MATGSLNKDGISSSRDRSNSSSELAGGDGGRSGKERSCDIGTADSEVNSESGDEDEGGYLARAATPADLDLSIAVTAAAQTAATQSAAAGAAPTGEGTVGDATITAASRDGVPVPAVAMAKAVVKVARIFPKHSDLADMEEVVAHICRRFPAAPKVLVGFSAGSNLTVQYCGAVNTYPRNPFLAAVSISNAHNLMKATRLLKARPLSDALMTAFLQEKLTEGLDDIRVMAERHGVQLDFRRLLSTRHFREFEELLICPIYGYASLDDYYREVSSGKDFENVRIPLLSLANLDDPIIHQSMTEVAVEAARRNPHVISVVTQRGGHLGWQHGWACEPWMHQLLAQFAGEVLRMHYEQGGSVDTAAAQQGALGGDQQAGQPAEAVQEGGTRGGGGPGMEGLRHRQTVLSAR